jgi:hypothetical protein
LQLSEKGLLGQNVFTTAGSELQGDGNDLSQTEVGEDLQQPLIQQRGWLNWLSLGLLGAAESIDAAVCPDEIIKVHISKHSVLLGVRSA